MTTGATATLTVRMRDLASSGFKGLGSTIKSTLAGVKKAGEQSRKAFDLAGQMSLAASGMQQLKGQLDELVTGPINDFKDFEFQMTRVGQLSGNLAKGEFEQLRQTAIDLGESTFFTGMEAAQGLEQLAVAGFDAQQQLEAIQPVLRLSQASGADLGRTADIASDLLGGFGLKASDTAKLTDVLTATFTSSTTTLEDLFEAFKLSAPIAAQAGISMEKLSVLTGLLGNAGIKGSAGGTALRGALLALTSPSKKAGKALRGMGLSGSFIEDNLQNPIEIIKGLRGELEGMSEKKRLDVLSTIFGRRQAGAVGILVSALDEGQGGLKKLEDAINSSEGSTEAFGKAMENTAKGKAKLLESQISKLKLELGEGLLPAQTSIMEMTRDMVAGLSDWTKENPKLTTGLGSLAVGLGGVLAVAIPLTFGIQSMITLYGLLTPVMAVALGPVKALTLGWSNLTTTMLTAGTTAGKVVGMLSASAGVAAAAFAGWQIGTIIDGWIGKLFDLRGELLSTELALQAGEEAAVNSTLLGAARTTQAATEDDTTRNFLAGAVTSLPGVGPLLGALIGSGALGAGAGAIEEAAVGNIARNQEQAVSEGQARSGLDVSIRVDQEGRVKGVAARAEDSKGPSLNVGAVAAN